MSIKDIPKRIGYLILLYMHGQLTPKQHDELDEWVEASDENQELFVEATDDDHIALILNKITPGE